MTQPSDGNGGSRREFIKSSGVLAGAALASTIASRSYAQSNDTIKLALVGCGGRGTGAADDAFEGSAPLKIVAMADVFEDRLEASHRRLADKHPQKMDVPAERRFVGFDAYEKAMDAGVDAVILATPPGWRPQHFEHAVKLGKHVFMEKPVAVDPAGVRRVLAANEEAKKKNLKVGVGLQRHHQAMYQEGIKRIKDGEIGDILFMRAYWNGRGVWNRPRVPGMNEMQYQMLNWYYFNWLCGDHIVEQHIHNIDVCNWIKDGHPIRAQAVGGRQVRTGKEYGQIYDHHMVEFTYEDGTVLMSECRHIEGTWPSVSEHVHGTKGYASPSSGLIYGGYSARGGTGDPKWKYAERRPPNPYEVEHAVLWDAVRNNTPHNEAEYGANSTMTAIFGRLASYSGQMLRWEDAIESPRVEAPGQDHYTWDTQPPVVPGPDGFYPVPMPGTYKPYEPLNIG